MVTVMICMMSPSLHSVGARLLRAPHPCAGLNENGFGHMQRLALVNPQV